MVKLFVNSEDPDQTPRSAASDLGLHCLPITLLGVSRLQWVNIFLIAPRNHMLWYLLEAPHQYVYPQHMVSWRS